MKFTGPQFSAFFEWLKQECTEDDGFMRFPAGSIGNEMFRAFIAGWNTAPSQQDAPPTYAAIKQPDVVQRTWERWCEKQENAQFHPCVIVKSSHIDMEGTIAPEQLCELARLVREAQS